MRSFNSTLSHYSGVSAIITSEVEEIDSYYRTISVDSEVDYRSSPTGPIFEEPYLFLKDYRFVMEEELDLNQDALILLYHGEHGRLSLYHWEKYHILSHFQLKSNSLSAIFVYNNSEAYLRYFIAPLLRQMKEHDIMISLAKKNTLFWEKETRTWGLGARAHNIKFSVEISSLITEWLSSWPRWFENRKKKKFFSD